MGDVDHARKRLGGSAVRRDQFGAVKDLDAPILHNDVDMVAHQAMRDAVPDRVHIHEGIERDATAQPLDASRQRANRERAEDRPLVALEAHHRRFTGRPVAALIGDRHPRGQVLLERGEGVEGLIRQRVPLDVFHARFRLAFGPCAIGRARARLHVPIATEGEVGRMETHRAGRAIATEHPRARIVAEQRARHAAEMREGRRDALAPIIAALIEKGFDVKAA